MAKKHIVTKKYYECPVGRRCRGRRRVCPVCTMRFLTRIGAEDADS